MPVLTSNYPAAQPGTPSLRPTPERVGALSEVHRRWCYHRDHRQRLLRAS
ncbi:MAG: hypothetical protein HND48_00415 [Chloroflexi bacterium]|nr:hypothetical protein [Chloroflexota bacterium]